MCLVRRTLDTTSSLSVRETERLSRRSIHALVSGFWRNIPSLNEEQQFWLQHFTRPFTQSGTGVIRKNTQTECLFFYGLITPSRVFHVFSIHSNTNGSWSNNLSLWGKNLFITNFEINSFKYGANKATRSWGT